MLAFARKLSSQSAPRRCLLVPAVSSALVSAASGPPRAAPQKPSQNPVFLPPPPVFPRPRPFSSQPEAQLSAPLDRLRGGCYDEHRRAPPSLPLCPGCGIHMQGSDPGFPGFFSTPSPKSPSYQARLHRGPVVTDEPRVSLSFKTGSIREGEATAGDGGRGPCDPKPVVCARCHSLRHYGRVKNAAVENLLPDFDFDRMVAPKLVSPSGTRSVVLMVVDAADFDGSFPRTVAKMVSASIDENAAAWKEGKPANVPRILLVVTKIDLLPSSSLSPRGLEYWVRQRAHEGGAGRIAGVHLVSSTRDWGVRNLVDHARQVAGPRGNVWAVGAQNAGKSTLINAMERCLGVKVSHLTEAPVPGTTLGIVRVEGILHGQAKLFDTPGILHPYQISMRLTAEEQKLVHIGKELRPRTYRLKAGHSVHIAGLIRLDVEELSADTIYVTVWASPLLPLHMGKMENACIMIEKHFGRQLQPPIGESRVGQLGKWVRREFNISGNSWEVSSVDIATAGLGWFAIGLKGNATLGAWTYEGVDVLLRNSLIPARAKIFEDTGFTVSKIVSQAESALSKARRSKRAKLAEVTNISDLNLPVTAKAGVSS